MDATQIDELVGQPAVWTHTDYHGQVWGTPVRIVGEKRIVYRVSAFFGEMAHVYVIVETADGKQHRVKPRNVIADKAEALWWHPESARQAFGE